MTARGMALERHLDGLHRLYAAQGRALIFKVPTPRSFTAAKRPAVWVDYSGVLKGGMAVALEAKMCMHTKAAGARSFPLRNISEHQRATLTTAHDLGAISAVYVRGGYDRVDDYLVPTSFIDALERKSFRWESVQHYKVPAGKTWIEALGPTLPSAFSLAFGWAYYCDNGWGKDD